MTMRRLLTGLALTALIASGLDLAAASRLPAGTELVELRSPSARHFSNGDGTIRAVLDGGEHGGTDVPDTLVAVTAGFTEYWLAMGVPLYVSTPNTEMRLWNFAALWMAVFSRPWAEWNTSSIPDSVTVDRVTVRLFGSDMMGFTPIGGVELHDINCRPSVYAQSQNGDTARALYEDCGDGATYASAACPRDFVWHDYRLSRDAARDLKQRLADNWFAIGLSPTGVQLPFSWARYVGLDSSWQFRPKLIVDYACAGVAERPVPLPAGQDLKVWPNPVRSGQAVLRYSLSPGERAEARVYDATGRVTKTLSLPVHSGTALLDVARLRPGVYIVQVGSGPAARSCRLTVAAGGE